MLIDNKRNGKVGDVLKQSIKDGSKLSIISGYFSIYAFAELKKELRKIKELRLLFTAPLFKNNYSYNHLSGEPEEIKYKNQLQQVRIARECAAWIKEKVKAQEVKTQGAIPLICIILIIMGIIQPYREVLIYLLLGLGL